MEREEALRLLRGGETGIAEWNRRRAAGELIPPLDRADLGEADLREADLREADLRGANLNGADLREAHLGGADLRESHLSGADLRLAYLSEADLRGAFLNGANLGGVRLGGADLGGANLSGTNLKTADLSEADLRGARLGYGILVGLDLSSVQGLAEVEHLAPSSLGFDTLSRSKGKIPENFLRGCGCSPWEVLAAKLYHPTMTPPIASDLVTYIYDAWCKGRGMINSCFISYSWNDSKFVEKLHNRLEAEEINVWLDKHDMIAGPLQSQVWKAIQINSIVILVLSEASTESDWVKNELDMARRKQKELDKAHREEGEPRQYVLCPVAVDDGWKRKVAADDNPGDPRRELWLWVKEMNVLDFSKWKTKAFDGTFAKLVRGLRTNYEPTPTPGA